MEKKKHEAFSFDNEQYFIKLLNNIGDPIFVKDAHSRLLLVNDAFCSIFQTSREDVIGKTLAEDVSPEERDIFLKIDREVIETGKENVNEESLTVRGGETKLISTKKTRFIDEQGNKYLIGIIRDVTERKKAELELKSAKEFSDKLIMSMQEGLIIVDLQGKIIQVNESACSTLGYTKKELTGMTLPYPFARKEDLKEITRHYKKIAAGKAPSFQFEYIKKNGDTFLATFSTGNITDNKGEVIALFATMKDISEDYRTQRLLEENALKSTKKKDVILKLASLVGQDFNNSFNLITELASETLDVERVSIWRFNQNRSEIICENLFLQSSKSHSGTMVLSRSDNPEYFEVLENQSTILIRDALKNTATRKFADGYLIPNSIRSLMDVFINSTNGHYGIICFEHVGDSLRNWTADEQEFATSIANIVSLMVESNERNIAEKKLIIANEELSKANTELKSLRNKLEQENIYLRNELDLVFNYEEMIYGSAEFGHVLSEIEKVAATNATVLILGESGTGKELLSRAIHNISLRNDKPLIKVNCSAIPRELIESELFGHKKGSFTGAYGDKIGKFELADGGTLFLDEIGELPLDMQPKLLRFLQEGEIEVVGGTGIKRLDVRVIAASNRNLKQATEKKQFREDLYFRLNVFPIEVPPLRKRKADIPLLVEHFIDKFNKEYTKDLKYVSDAAMEKLIAYDWPGNIRELENLIERAAILSSGETLVIPGFESEAQKQVKPINTNNLSLEAMQRKHILYVLDKCDWKISGARSASELLGLKPSTLRDRMTKLGIKK
ncbi:sigma 54-interacting transcriptional regulator [Robiginitalea sp. IMCC44478]|uniref:sigma 54-interacting transcriptional regulator n=1 Tax=Robiginitalea sp. IMCC44478 TaxID=3459122 RepID=UPI004041EB52